MVYKTVLEAIGDTPLIKLNKIVDEDMADIYVKYEGVNIGGSIKTRTAYKMIEEAEIKGLINKDTTIVEATSGNQGIALALIGAVKGYRVIIVMPDSVSVERRKIIKQYGAELILVADKGDIGKCIKECQKIAFEYGKKKEYYLPSQFENMANVRAQRNTGLEIIKELKSVDGFCSGIGTGGTITGIGSVLKEHNPNTEIWAIEPEKAAILSGDIHIESHMQMGIGDGIIPPILDKKIYNRVVKVTDKEAIETARKLAKEEGILAGISSGTNVFVALQMARELKRGKKVVTILPDSSERYFSTPLFLN